MATDISLADANLNRYVERHKHDVIAYSRNWFDLISKLYGYTFIPLTTHNAQAEITGFLPLCYMRSPLTGRRLVSLPFSDICPLLASDETSANDLIDQAIEVAKEYRVKYLELRTGVSETLAKRQDLVEENQLYVRWLMPLSADPDNVWSSLRKPVQHQVKKAQKLGVQVRIAQKREDMEHYYRLHLQTRSKKHGMPAQPAQYFYGLWDAFASTGSVQLLLAEHEGRVIAGMILLASGSTIRYAYGASDEQFLKLAPNNLLMWTAITLGCTNGYQTLDMGRTSRDNEGLMEFKRRWGATLEALPYYYYPQIAGLASTSEESWKFRALTSCWKRLPLSVAATLGGKLYKHLG
ncbi:MAG TPA: GNAT family N-acetyltransferase [Ktedonobacteraceae bacterium]|nr:GNAT family N-acetyltransferase [Ktedonobacteraceae bacterium]